MIHITYDHMVHQLILGMIRNKTNEKKNIFSFEKQIKYDKYLRTRYEI